MKSNLLKKKKILLNMYNLIMEDSISLDYMLLVSKEIANLEKGLKDLIAGMEDINIGSDSELFEYQVEYHSEFIETLYGSCFIICQKKISAIVSRVMEYKNCLTEEERSDFERRYFSLTNKHEIMEYDKERRNEQMSYATIIDAYANYFKHYEENCWKGDWNEIKDQGAKRTAKILLEAGADQDKKSTILTDGLHKLTRTNEKLAPPRLLDLILPWAGDLFKLLNEYELLNEK